MTDGFDYIFKILILGDSGVGKSSTLLRLVDQDFKNQHHSTIGVEFGSKIITHHDLDLESRCPSYAEQRIKLQVWDTAGQERFRAVTKSYFRNTAGIIMVFDITDRKSFDSLEYWYQELENTRGSHIDQEKLKKYQESQHEHQEHQEQPEQQDNIQYDQPAKQWDLSFEPETKQEDFDQNIAQIQDSEEEIIQVPPFTLVNNSFSNSNDGSSDSSNDDYEYFAEENTDMDITEISNNEQPVTLDPVEFVHVRYPSIILVGNKVDLEQNNREVYREEAVKFAQDHHFDMYIETSAKNGDNIELVFNNLTKYIYGHIKERGTGLVGVINPQRKNPTWYELETYRNKNKCAC